MFIRKVSTAIRVHSSQVQSYRTVKLIRVGFRVISTMRVYSRPLFA